MSKLVWLTRLQVKNFAASAPHRLLKALKPSYLGRLKCIFIDPPHNPCGVFENPNNNLKHFEWPGTLDPRQMLLRNPHAEASLNTQNGFRPVRMAGTQLIGTYPTAGAQLSMAVGTR